MDNRDAIISCLKNIKEKIIKLLERKKKSFVYEPTIFGEDNVEDLIIAHKVRQKQMKEGEIPQIVIGNWIGWEDLGVGHPSGLDCRKKDNSIIIELKNKYNTCNSGSELSVLNKLAKYKKENPSTRCIFGIVNPKPKCKKLHEIKIHNGVEIEKIQGMELFKLVLKIKNRDCSKMVIDFVNDIKRRCD